MAKLIGLCTLGKDADVRYRDDGQAVANLDLVFDYGKKGDDGLRPSQWIRASLWGKRAEALAEYLTKGTQISVVLDDPHIKTDTGKDGREFVNLLARVNDIELVRRPKTENSERPARQPERQAERQPERQASVRQPPRASRADDFDDDIPF